MDYQIMERTGWTNIFGIKDEMMVTISEIFKFR